MSNPKAPRPPVRRPVHVAVAIGASTGLYAITLLGVTRLQIAGDRALMAERDPALQAISLLGAHHDRMSAELDTAGAAYAQGADRFTALVAGLPGLADGLDRLDSTLAAIEGELRQMPGSFNIPKAPPRTSSGSGGGGSATVPVAPKPPAAQPPPTQGSTGASGAP